MAAENPRVLVVDDDDAIRSMIERVLRREAYQVESARDGFEAIEKLSQTEYGTILLDLMMPRIDGHGSSATSRKSASSGRSRSS